MTEQTLLNIFYVFIYFMPTIIALYRMAGKTMQILVINLFLGWTVIAWVICLSWGFSGESKNVVD